MYLCTVPNMNSVSGLCQYCVIAHSFEYRVTVYDKIFCALNVYKKCLLFV